MIKKIIVYLYNLKKRLLFNKKIRGIHTRLQNNAILQNIPKNVKESHFRIWSPLSTTKNPKWLEVYSSISKIVSEKYIPESIYYTIVEPVLNNKQVVKSFSEKNLYPIIYPSIYFPVAILSNIEGCFYNKEYKNVKIDKNSLNKLLKKHDKFVIKPSLDSGGGFKVDFFRNIKGRYMNQDGQEFSLEYIQSRYRKNYIIQELIKQQDFFSRFNPSSVNTVRIFTYRSVITERIIPLHAVLRVGKEGHEVDNQASGGLACGINMKTGKLKSFAINKTGDIFTRINQINLKGQPLLIPRFREMVEISKQIATRNYYARLLGLDFTLDSQENIKLIEVNNNNNEINFYQMTNGPLFGEYTQEIIDFCIDHPISFVLDYEV